MVESLALILFSFIKRNKELIHEDEIYIYGLEIIVSTILDTLVIIILSLMLNKFIESLIFLLIFCVLRLFTGGYHANTYLGCLTVLIIIYLAFIELMLLITQSNSLIYFLMMWFFSLPIIVKFAPLDDENKPLDEQEKRRFNKKSIIITMIIFIISIVLFFTIKNICFTVTITVFESVILMIIKILWRGGKINEKS